MRDLIIPGKVIKRELIILIVSFVAAVLLNIYSIIKYKTAWGELFSQLHVVVAVTLIIYLLVILFRLLISPIFRLLTHKRGK
ncbi:MAG: hypothetical protein ACOZDD_11495 [Bacteroidota bacterium]